MTMGNENKTYRFLKCKLHWAAEKTISFRYISVPFVLQKEGNTIKPSTGSPFIWWTKISRWLLTLKWKFQITTLPPQKKRVCFPLILTQIVHLPIPKIEWWYHLTEFLGANSWFFFCTMLYRSYSRKTVHFKLKQQLGLVILNIICKTSISNTSLSNLYQKPLDGWKLR